MDSKLKSFVLVILLWGYTLQAQQHDNAPVVFESSIQNIIGGVYGQVAIPEAVAIGDILAVCFSQDDSYTGPYTVTSALGNTFTVNGTTTTPNPSDPTQITHIFTAYSKVTVAGTENITVGIPAGHTNEYGIEVGHLRNVDTIDGTVATGTAAASSTSVSTTQTTTVNGDYIFSCSAAAISGSGELTPQVPAEYLAFTSAFDSGQPLSTMLQTDFAGSYTVTHKWQIAAAQASFAMQSIAFKPLGLGIITTKLHDGANGTAFYDKLKSVGGTGASYTYAKSSGNLPTGISLNTSTGELTGTPSSSGFYNACYTVTDGVTTSSPTCLDLNVGNAFNTLTINSRVAKTSDTHNFTTTCGDLIVAIAEGNDTHSGNGFVLAVNGVNNNIHATCSNLPFHRTRPLGGTYPGAVQVYYGQATSSGSCTLTFNDNTLSSNLPWIFEDISNAQFVIDPVTVSLYKGGNTKPYNNNNSYTTVVPNELLQEAVITTGVNPPDTITISSPFTQTVAAFVGVSGFDTMALGEDSVGSPGSVTGNVSVNETSGELFKNTSTNLIFSLRASSFPAPVCGTNNLRHYVTEY